MNQLYEKKCECQSYDDDNRSSLIKMELPEDEETSNIRNLSRSITSTISFFYQLLVLILVGYCLWRIHEIEITVNASDRFINITRLIENNNNLNKLRHVRSANYFDPNGLGIDGKDLPRGMMLTAKNESPKKPMNKDEFVQLMNNLFDKIQYMHNDTDRSHFENNMKAVFRAWTPVFDALLPRDMFENQDSSRVRRSVDKSSEESAEKKNIAKSDDKTSKESSEEKKSERVARSAVKSNENSSSEEKKPARVTRSVQQSSKESVEIKDHSKQDNSAENNSEESVEVEKKVDNAIEADELKADDMNEEKNEESSEEEHVRKNRSADSSSSESLESIEKKYKKYKKLYKKITDDYAKVQNRQFLPNAKHSGESSESVESLESKEKKLKKIFNDNNRFVYQMS